MASGGIKTEAKSTHMASGEPKPRPKGDRILKKN